jgi:hypothetical protein
VKLPVEPERLRRSFPLLTDEDLSAYSRVTGDLLLARPGTRGKKLAEVLAAAQRAREKDPTGALLDEDERLGLAYVRALEKMQKG